MALKKWVSFFPLILILVTIASVTGWFTEDFYSDNYTLAHVNEPSEKIDVTEQHGRVRRMFAEITFSANFTDADTLFMGKLPKGARVIDGKLVAEQDGGTPALIFGVGWQANGSDAADADGFFAAQDASAGAIAAEMAFGSVAGYNKKFAEETIVEIVPTTSASAYSGKSIKLELLYVVD